jgi:hypothetical protein
MLVKYLQITHFIQQFQALLGPPSRLLKNPGPIFSQLVINWTSNMLPNTALMLPETAIFCHLTNGPT